MAKTIGEEVFANFAPQISQQTKLRQAITSAYRRAEAECLPPLLKAATFEPELKEKIKALTEKLVTKLRAKYKGTGVEGLVHEYSLSSQEGIALMCLAEALLRIPDQATRNALIRDKIAGGDWKSHMGGGRSLFVNAATWGLVVTGKLTSTVDNKSLSSALTRLISRCGEPVIRKGVDMAMRMMGEQFVRGETIEEALKASRALEARGFRYSYDMLGEAATTAEDAERYYRDYENAIHAIGKASNGKGVYEGAGISIKLSALHPRYTRAQARRVMNELMPKVKQLALLSKTYNIGLNIDAEEADRLELSLDLLENLCFDDDLKGWNGIGFVVQAYGRRCPFVLDYIIDLARRSHHRIMVRLVKGAYWDAEIKRGQVDGLESFPVYTRKVYTDVSYIANAKKLLAVPDAVFPQFATHNAQTLSTIYHLAGPDQYTNEQYEFQCLHGMGEPLYDEVVGKDKLQRPARIYAPVGTHETLLAYLVRRLLENGANSSFVNRISDKSVSIDDMTQDPADIVAAMPVIGAQHDAILSPDELFAPSRQNSSGYDLSNETTLTMLGEAFQQAAREKWLSQPTSIKSKGKLRPVFNPADHRLVVGEVIEATEAEAADALKIAQKALKNWCDTSVEKRAQMLEKAADLMQERMPILLGLIAMEAGKSIPNAIAEVREAIDFLRFYAVRAKKELGKEHKPLGAVVCISPWNFPLAIFVGQLSAALVAGNTVVAKPAEETPLIAAEGVRILHEAGIPRDALQLLPGDGKIGAILVAMPETAGVMFTGSTEVARLIQAELSNRLTPAGKPVTLIAETGGQNAMIVDSSALAEQVVFDVIASAFDSAGQRCSALRVLCLQEDVADRVLKMLKGALHELSVGMTDQLCVDIGPVITNEAKTNIEKHIEAMRAAKHNVEQLELSQETRNGTFVAPTLIEIPSIHELKREVFGPVLHVVRYKRNNIDALIDDINATGYGLTFGLHTRLDETIAHVSSRVQVGNIYINRNVIGAVVGSQPFGGLGLSGTGPKAGGFLYLGRLVQTAPKIEFDSVQKTLPILDEFAKWLGNNGHKEDENYTNLLKQQSLIGVDKTLPGPVGEENRYSFHPRGLILLMPETQKGFYRQLAAVFATGNKAAILFQKGNDFTQDLPENVRKELIILNDLSYHKIFSGALIEGDEKRIQKIQQDISRLQGPLVLVQALSTKELETMGYCLHWLVEEVSISINTAAAGGNASLMSIG